MYKNWGLLTTSLIMVLLFSCKHHHRPQNSDTFERTTKQTVFENRDSLQQLANKLNIQQLSYSIDTFLAPKGLNANILIAQYGKIIYTKSQGIADYSTKEPLTPDASFQLASVSKVITGLAALILIDNGYLRLEDSIQKFFPTLPYRGIKVRDLLCHRSGLPNYMYFSKDYITKEDTILSNEDVINLLIKYKPEKQFSPDTKFAYCNTNFALLASIIERVSKMPFEQFVQEQIFTPLGMEHTWFFYPQDTLSRKGKTRGYVGNWNEAKPDMLDGVLGDKGVYSTTADMFKLDQALYTDQIVSMSLLQEAFQPRSFEHPGAKNYGYGFRLLHYEDGTSAVYHNGWWHGYNSVFFRLPAHHITIIILNNKFNRQTYYSINGILEILRGPVSVAFTDDNTPE